MCNTHTSAARKSAASTGTGTGRSPDTGAHDCVQAAVVTPMPKRHAVSGQTDRAAGRVPRSCVRGNDPAVTRRSRLQQGRPRLARPTHTRPTDPGPTDPGPTDPGPAHTRPTDAGPRLPGPRLAR